MAHSDVDITLEVVEVKPESPQHVSVVMRRPCGFDHDPGDWIDFGRRARQRRWQPESAAERPAVVIRHALHE